MNLGKFKIDLIKTCIFGLDGGAMFGVVPKALWSKAYHPGDDLNRIPLAAMPMLIRWDDKVVLVDTGNGTKLNDKIASIYGINRQEADIVPALLNYGISPENVDAVILTHLHFDHAGGATSFSGNDIIPTFPNAKYYVQKRQFEWAVAPNDKDKASFFNENYVPLQSAGVLEFTDGDGELFPGISLIEVSGHTQSMQLVKISDGDNSLLYCADLLPTLAHVPIPFVMGYDNKPLTTIEEKKKILSKALDENWLLAFEHDAFTQGAKLGRNDKGYFVEEKIEIL